MNTAACLVSDVDVLPLESVVDYQPEILDGHSPPLADVSLKVPSDRDLQIYEVVVFAGRSQREVAKEFGVSQPRVNQILKELAAWMADNTPSFCAGLTPEQKLRLVHYNVVQQLEYQRCSLMQAWEESRHGTETVSRTTIVNGVRRTTATNRPSRANARYVDAAARVSLSIAKLSGWTPTAAVTEAPQDSPWWRVGEESGVGGQEPAESRQAVRTRRKGVGRRPLLSPVPCPLSPVSSASESRLSPWEERAKDSKLTRAEMDAVTAEQEAVCAALQAKVEDLESKIQQSENSLSPGSDPLLPEEGDARDSTRRPRSGEEPGFHAERGSQDKRREFLRGGPPRMAIREYIGPESQPDK